MTLLEPLSGHEDCFSNELLRAIQSLRSTILVGSLNAKAWYQNGNRHITLSLRPQACRCMAHCITQQSRNARAFSGAGAPHQLFKQYNTYRVFAHSVCRELFVMGLAAMVDASGKFVCSGLPINDSCTFGLSNRFAENNN